MSTFENCQPETDASVENCQPKPVKCGCGGEAKVDKHTYYRALPTYGVRCHRCGQQTRQFYMNEAEAIQAWNRAMGAYGRTEYFEDDDE